MCAEKLKEKKGLNLIEWYNDVILKSEMADFSDVKGFVIYRPYGYSMWESLQNMMNDRIKKLGVKNAYFPLLVPEKTMQKEKDHVQGFNPEVAWVTMGGERKLDERLAIRPTSETVISEAFAKWITSYRDLPMMINQWNTVVRWESKETRLFLRGKEVLWQEGHCIFRTEKEAEDNAISVLKIYKEIMEDLLAVPVLVGRKSQGEKFAGAVATYTVEAILPNNFTVQSATSHYLGQGFSKAFGIKFLDENNTWNNVYQSSWGISMRALGAMVLVHGDDRGLVLPPRVAPVQVVIIPIFSGKDTDQEIVKHCEKILHSLVSVGVRAEMDGRKGYSAGWKFNEHDMKGVPIKIDVGARELSSGKISVKIRFNDKKMEMDFKDLADIKKILEDIQREMFESKLKSNKERIKTANDRERFISGLKEANAVFKAAWCGGQECEDSIKGATGATSRLIPIEKEKLIEDKCIFCGKKSEFNAYFAQSY